MAGHRQDWTNAVGAHDLTAADGYFAAEEDWAAEIRDAAIAYAEALRDAEVALSGAIAGAEGGLQGDLAEVDAEYAYAEVKANAVYEIAVDGYLNRQYTEGSPATLSSNASGSFREGRNRLDDQKWCDWGAKAGAAHGGGSVHENMLATKNPGRFRGYIFACFELPRGAA